MTDEVRPIGMDDDAVLRIASKSSDGRSIMSRELSWARLLGYFACGVTRKHSPMGGLAAQFRAVALAPYRHKWLYATDIVLAGISFVLAGIFRLGVEVSLSRSVEFLGMMMAVPLYMVTCAIVFPLTGLYRRDWRFVSVGDLKVIVWSVVLSLVLFVSAMFVATRLQMIPRTAIAIEFLLLAPMLTAVRLRSRFHELSLHSALSSNASRSESIPVLLIGAGADADIFLRALQGDCNSRYLPVGLLEDSKDQQGLKIRGVPVLGTLSEFDKVLGHLANRNKWPRHIIFTRMLSKFASNSVEPLISRADSLGIAVSRLQPPTELRNAHKKDLLEVRPIELTDLLERPQATLDREAIGRLIEGRRVLVTGAGGSIGSELVLQIAALKPAELILAEGTEFNLYAIDMELAETVPNVNRAAYLCNIRDVARVNEIFERHKPELVFHAAALKHVPMVELNPTEGILTNVIGTMNVAEAAKRVGVLAMVQVSTDKVVNPTSVMGATKRLAELYCQALDLDDIENKRKSRFMTVRFGNVLGSSGSLIPLFQRQIAKGGPLTITDPKMTRFFMTVREAVELTLQASALGLEKKLGQGEIFVLDMGAPVRIIDIARRMIRLAGFTPDREISIKIIGCRPGEKLYEELFDASEKGVDSPVPGVFGAVPVPVDLQTLRSAFARLRKLAEVGDAAQLIGVMAEVLPNYRPLITEPVFSGKDEKSLPRRSGRSDILVEVRPQIAGE